MSKLKLSALHLAIGSTLLSGFALNANAADDSVEEVERIEVTGSRISRGDMETALPVTVISSADIKATGLADVGSVIAQLPFNSQGSFISDAGSSATNHSSSGLRGLNSNRTLILINGKRIAPSASFGGESTNLNLVPLDAVDRIDVLQAGASAIYGSDAIGGVINVILKRDFEGLLFKANASRPSAKSGDEDGFSMTVGNSSDKGSALLVFEHKEWEGIRYGTRDPQLNANWEEGYNRSSLYTPEGNYHPVDAEGNRSGDWVAGDCPADRIIPQSSGGERCGYNFLDGKNYIPKRTKNSIFGNFTYNITDELSWQTEVMALQDKTNTAGTSVWTPGGIVMSADNPNNPTFGSADATDIRAYTRLVDVADRETDFTSNVFHIGTTLTLDLDEGSLQVNGTASRQDVDVQTNHYIFRDKFDEAVQAGLYNPFVLGGNASQETLNSFLHTSTRKAQTVTRSLGATWAADTGFELDGGTIAYAVGAEWSDYSFEDKLDRQSAPGGSAWPTFGGNSGGDRSYRAAFAELDVPVTEDLSLKLATRYDKYSLPDVGQQSSSINVRYQALDNLVVRASYSEGFRAPSIDDLLSEEALSFNAVTDPIFCATLTDAQKADEEFCTPDGDTVERRSEGNKDLKPETSEQYGLGVVWDITESMALTLDYYDIQINQQVQFLGAQDVVDLEVAGLLGNFDQDKINVSRDADQRITGIQTGSINQVGTSTSGIDINFNARFETDNIGTFYYKFIGNYVLEFETQDTPLADRYDEVDSVSTPEYRLTTSIGYGYEDFHSQLTFRYIPSYSDLTAVEISTGEEAERMESWGIVDLDLNYDFDEYGVVAFGVRNIADKMPKLVTRVSTLRHGFDDANHSIEGRVMYGSYTIKF